MATDSRWWEEYECAMDAHPSSREEAQEIVRAAVKVAGGKYSFLQLAGSVLADAVQVAGVPQQSRIVCPVAILTDAQTASSGEVFCDDPINPDVYSETPLEDALAWITGD